MDSRVLQTQKWLNDTYGNVANFPKVDEDGITGNSIFHALIYALQIEIGVENPDGIFGKDTLSNVLHYVPVFFPVLKFFEILSIYYRVPYGVRVFLLVVLPVFSVH